MRISDWSSDVCSSDLEPPFLAVLWASSKTAGSSSKWQAGSGATLAAKRTSHIRAASPSSSPHLSAPLSLAASARIRFSNAIDMLMVISISYAVHSGASIINTIISEDCVVIQIDGVLAMLIPDLSRPRPTVRASWRDIERHYVDNDVVSA